MYKKTLCFYLIVCAISLASCNTTNLTSNSDPLELLNRKIFRANDTVDQTVLRPVSLFYRESTPQLLQNDIENFLQWLDTPNALVNNLLQGNFHQAETTLKYFFLQSFHLGHVDLNITYGINFQNEDFGQTLGSWGVSKGPFLMIPLYGPSTPRSLAGRSVSSVLSGTFAIEETDVRIGVTALDALETRARYLEVETLIVGDRYSFIRDSYKQYLDFESSDGLDQSHDFVDDMDDFLID